MEYYPVGGGASIRAVSRSRRYVNPTPTDRLDALEQELNHLRTHCAQEEHIPGPVLPDSGYMPNIRLPPIAHNASGAQQPQQPLMIHVPYPVPPQQQQQLAVPSGGTSQEHRELLVAHKELLKTMELQQERHSELLQTHTDLMKAHADLIKQQLKQTNQGKPKQKPHPALGVVRLDYNYPPAGGDTDCPASFAYDVFYRVIPGLTFDRAQEGKFDEATERRFAEGIKFLEQRGVSAITGDCGFMMAFQVLARKIATKPIFMSSMVQCPVIAAAFEPSDKLLILTANGRSLKPQKEVLMSSCGFDVDEDRFIIKGCQDVPGFDAVAKGEKVPLDVVQPGIVRLTMTFLKEHADVRGILLECTELPPYADALRAATGLPVWDCITGADFYVNAYLDNPRFGVNDWQAEWDEEQDDYTYGMNLVEKDKVLLENKATKAQAKKKAKADPKTKTLLDKTRKKLARKQAPILGVVRLDYNYPPAEGDIDCPGSYDYEVLFRSVPGLTFEMAQAGRMTAAVHAEFVGAVRWLESKGACGITGDCGFMMAFQPIAAKVANVPVFLSSMVQCPMVSVAFDKYDKVMILTANSQTLKPQKDVLLNSCGFDVDDTRFVIYGCQDVPGFDAVAKSEKVDVEYVTPGIVKMVKDIIAKQPTIRAVIMECTELPPYSDAVRKATQLPVFDAITCADFFVSARKDNPRFGLNQWQNDWDGEVNEYVLGQNLSSKQRSRMVNLGR